jgi:hypothetical protein
VVRYWPWSGRYPGTPEPQGNRIDRAAGMPELGVIALNVAQAFQARRATNLSLAIATADKDAPRQRFTQARRISGRRT